MEYISVLLTAHIYPYFYGKSNHHLHYGNPHNSPGKTKNDPERLSKYEFCTLSAVVLFVCFSVHFLLEFLCRHGEYQC